MLRNSKGISGALKILIFNGLKTAGFKKSKIFLKYMKITIDTKEDSHEEIKKVIALLTHLIGQTPMSNSRNIFDDSKPTEETGNLFNIFDSKPETEETTETEEEPQEDAQVELY